MSDWTILCLCAISYLIGATAAYYTIKRSR